MKELYKINEQAGEAHIDGSVGIDTENVSLTFTVKHPHKAITDKIFAFADSVIDKLEDVIPGDQKEMAVKAKAEVREFAMKLLGVPAPAVEAPAAPQV